ncbi:hypothetical protein CH35J_003630 [Colletotrichum higginsianum]|uniref:Uncharacterized protein n=1 Tax=Colletotrichum higginsianum TaxID=80884 RepID=A0A4V4NCX1_9PEZI|nr:hypothetical protein CH35J_003630 [Colletotrichum higginsianum]
MKPYFRPAATAAADLALSWRPVLQESLMEPRVSAATVRIYCIDAREELWLEVTTGGAFLMAHGYISVALLWFMGMRETLLDVLGKNEGDPSVAVRD